MLKKKGKAGGRATGGLTGTEQAALAARQAGLLDAYTESGQTASRSESDKFKEGYVKKGGKKKERKSESEEVNKQKEEEEEEKPENWDDEEEPVESWEDIEAPEMPVPLKVKQEQRKQEKQRKKAEERKSKETERMEVLSSGLENVSLKEPSAQNSTSPSHANTASSPNPKPKPSPSSDQKPMPSQPDQANPKMTDGDKPPPEAVMAEREAKKAAKAAAKAKSKQKKNQGGATTPDSAAAAAETPAACAAVPNDKLDKPADKEPTAPPAKEKTKEQMEKESEKAKRKAEFEAKRAAEQKEKESADVGGGGEAKSKAELKAERRAKQEAQRAAKAQTAEAKKTAPTAQKVRIPDEVQADQAKAEKKLAKTLASQNLPPRTKASRLVPLFSHLHQYEKENCITKDLPVVGSAVHPSFLRIGLQVNEEKTSEGEARCLDFLQALEDVAVDTVSNLKADTDIYKEIDNALKPNLTFLKQCRPLSVSMSNAVRSIKGKLRSLSRNLPPEELISEARACVQDFVEENLNLAAKQISNTANTKIQNGDVILTYSCSLLVERLLTDAAAAAKSFKVVVADSRLHCRGSAMAERLVAAGIDTTYLLLSAVGQVLPAVSKVFLGCEGVMANGCVLAELGTSQLALLASSAGLPVLVCCQTFKFTERVQTDSFVNNELRDPDTVARIPRDSWTKQVGSLDSWRDLSSLHLLNLVYDVTPASMVSAVITELSVIPTTSVPVILRLKNSEGQLAS